jgi:hypothetical protein
MWWDTIVSEDLAASIFRVTTLNDPEDHDMNFISVKTSNVAFISLVYSVLNFIIPLFFILSSLFLLLEEKWDINEV